MALGERRLFDHLSGAKRIPHVYGFGRVGVRPLSRAYEELVSRLSIDAIVLVDGGTDALMRGDELRC
ncbi:MAG: DUF1152 domain-containing protein [Deltaproteobacteria bacterium]|nr:DUF1152 domain-containing protein [Deltaproteobacteria bacterium]